MSERKKIKTALISVFNKSNLEPIILKLNGLGVKLFSTGGTQQFIEGLGVAVTAVETLTAYPSILGGRVKTLHPKIFGGILGRRWERSDVMQLEEYEIPEIDLVIVDLYPFAATVASGASDEEIIEKIDIGGISLIRAAAKNFKDVLIIPSRNEYHFLLELLNKEAGSTALNDRKLMAKKGFEISTAYDSAILNYFSTKTVKEAKTNGTIAKTKTLRYGENPHQKGFFTGDLDSVFDQIHGKELSYNNLLDIDSAVCLLIDFPDTTFAILKHNNACGLASRNDLEEAWNLALASDPVSAFGGILITNAKVEEKTAEKIDNLFFELIIAPDYSDKALALLKKKKNRIILIQKKIELPAKMVRTVLNGILEQDRDLKTESVDDLRVVTDKEPDSEEKTDLEFANKIAKHSKSNTIVLARHRQLLASGVGQTSRVDALEQAIAKALKFGFSLKGAVMASDAFFPFPDCVEIAHKAGISSVIQPGGSIKDKDSIGYCNSNNISMVFTGTRHFKH